MKPKYDVGINSAIFSMGFTFFGYAEVLLTVAYLIKLWFNEDGTMIAEDDRHYLWLIIIGLSLEYGLYFVVARIILGISYGRMLRKDKELKDKTCLKIIYQINQFLFGILPTESLMMQGTKNTSENYDYITTLSWMTISRRIVIFIRLVLIFVFFFNLYDLILEPTIGYTFVLATYAGITGFSLFPSQPDKPEKQSDSNKEPLIDKEKSVNDNESVNSINSSKLSKQMMSTLNSD